MEKGKEGEKLKKKPPTDKLTMCVGVALFAIHQVLVLCATVSVYVSVCAVTAVRKSVGR